MFNYLVLNTGGHPDPTTDIYTALIINTRTLGYGETVFLATIDSDTHVPEAPNPIVFDVAVLNTRGHTDPNTGIYTVPLDGTYGFCDAESVKIVGNSLS